MNRWSFYHPGTGQFWPHKLTVSGPDQVARNTPGGYVAIEGHFDHLSQRFDLATGTVVDFVPDAPDADHEWDGARRRWKLKAAAAAAAAAHDAAMRRIEQLERSQLRALRELALDPKSKPAGDALKATDDEIAGLRASLLASPPRQKLPDIPKAPAPVAVVKPPPVVEPARPLPGALGPGR